MVLGAGASEWDFAKRPFWIFSHLFALSVVGLFVFLGTWQLDRLDERKARNDIVLARVSAEPLRLTEVPWGFDLNLDYRPVVVEAEFVEEDFARIVNRSKGGVAGEHVVGIAELSNGGLIAVNRGFVPSNSDVQLEPVPVGSADLQGWLRDSVPQEGWFSVDDTGAGRLLPRFNTADITKRFGSPLPDVWVQIAPDLTRSSRPFPDPIDLPPLDEGPHFAYAVQWFIFATLGVGFYAALLRRQRNDGQNSDTTELDGLAP